MFISAKENVKSTSLKPERFNWEHYRRTYRIRKEGNLAPIKHTTIIVQLCYVRRQIFLLALADWLPFEK